MQVNTLRWGSKGYNQSGDSSYLVLRIVGQVLVQIGQAVGVLAQVVVYHTQLVARRCLPALHSNINTLITSPPKRSPRPLPPCVCMAALLHSPRGWVVQVVAATVD
jgi:hypothetical protein